MKRTILTNFSCLFVLFLALQLPAQNLPEVIAVREIKLEPTTNPIEYLNDAQELDEKLQQYSKGLSAKLWYGDRGFRKDEYVHTWIFELKANRDYYFPVADAEDTPRFDALMEEMAPVSDLDDERVESGMGDYTDYVVLGYKQMDNPKSGEIMALRELYVKPGQEAAFEAFATDELHPTLQQHIDGMYGYILKGDRGERKGQYLHVYFFESYEARDRYFPVEGGELSQEDAEAVRELSGLNEQMEAFLVEGSGDIYTDYILVK